MYIHVHVYTVIYITMKVLNFRKHYIDGMVLT